MHTCAVISSYIQNWSLYLWRTDDILVCHMRTRTWLRKFWLAKYKLILWPRNDPDGTVHICCRLIMDLLLINFHMNWVMGGSEERFTFKKSASCTSQKFCYSCQLKLQNRVNILREIKFRDTYFKLILSQNIQGMKCTFIFVLIINKM